MEPFYILVNDRKNRKYDIVGPMRDDTTITNNIANMQKEELEVNCHTADIDTTMPGYTKEDGLYDSLIDKYNQLTGKNMKKW